MDFSERTERSNALWSRDESAARVLHGSGRPRHDSRAGGRQSEGNPLEAPIIFRVLRRVLSVVTIVALSLLIATILQRFA